MPNDHLGRPSNTPKEASSPGHERYEPLGEQDLKLINGDLASSITTAPAGPIDYAPPARRMEKLAELASRLTAASTGSQTPPARRPETPGELAVRTVESFSVLPTTELDEMIRAVKEEIAQLEREAAEIRGTYVAHTDRLAAAIKRLAAGCELAKETLAKLREQCATLPETLPGEAKQPQV